MRARYSSLALQVSKPSSKSKTLQASRSVPSSSSPRDNPAQPSIMIVKDAEDYDGSISELTFSLLLSSGLPVVFILSGGYSREDGFSLQRRIIPAIYRNRVSVELVHWPALTEKKILNHLQHIRDSKHLSSRIFPDERLQLIAEQANGDMRQAINQLYFSSISNSNNNIQVTFSQSQPQQRSQVNAADEAIDLTNDDSNDDEDDLLFLSSSPSPPMKRKKLTKLNGSSPQGTFSAVDYTQPTQKTQSTQRTASHQQQQVHKWSKDDHQVSTNTAPDTTLGTFHILGRLLHTRLNSDGKADKDLEIIEKSSELEVDKLMSMLFTNGASHVHDMLLKSGFLGDDQTTLTALLACSQINEDVSLAERWYQRRYDPAALIERGHDDDDGIFPAAYCKSLLVRSVPVAKRDFNLDVPRNFSSTSSTSRLYKLHTARRAKQAQLNDWRMYSFNANLSATQQQQEMSVLREGYNEEGEVIESLPIVDRCASMAILQSQLTWAMDILPIMGSAIAAATSNTFSKSVQTSGGGNLQDENGELAEDEDFDEN